MKIGRFPIPREPLASQLRALNNSFQAELASLPSGRPDTPPRYVAVTAALYAAATAAYGPPGPSQPVPSAVRGQVANLRSSIPTQPDWASLSPHLVEVARLKEQIRGAWDVILLQKDVVTVGLAPLPSAPGQPTKVLVGTEMRDGWVRFLRDTVYLNGYPVGCSTSQDYIRVLGRHALPYLFQPIDSRCLFSGARTACRALRAAKLPPRYPVAMFIAKCYGTVNWFTSVRPPLPRGHASAPLYGRLGLARHPWLGPHSLCRLPPRNSRRGR